jgi:hypothetical protein
MGGIGARSWSVDFEGRVDFPASTWRGDGGGALGVRSSLTLGMLIPCARSGIARLCAIAAAGALSGEGLGVNTNDRATTFYAAGGVRLGAEIPVWRRLAYAARADLMAPITRTTLRDYGEAVWTTPPLSAVMSMGLVVDFGR